VTVTGQRIEGRGVVPDQVVEPGREDLLAGRDPILEAALDWIAKGSVVR
jgi:C-terminal processing protease CtpA/Prc